MPAPGLEVFEELTPERDRMAFEAPNIILRAEDGGVSEALILYAKQTAVLRIEIEKEGVFDRQDFRGSWTVDSKPHHLIGTVAMVVDQMLGDCGRAIGAVCGDRKPSQSKGSDLLVLGFDLTPGDLAI